MFFDWLSALLPTNYEYASHVVAMIVRYIIQFYNISLIFAKMAILYTTCCGYFSIDSMIVDVQTLERQLRGVLEFTPLYNCLNDL